MDFLGFSRAKLLADKDKDKDRGREGDTSEEKEKREAADRFATLYRLCKNFMKLLRSVPGAVIVILFLLVTRRPRSILVFFTLISYRDGTLLLSLYLTSFVSLRISPPIPVECRDQARERSWSAPS